MEGGGFKFFIMLFVIAVSSLVFHVECSTSLRITETFTSCTNQLLAPELPNLSHAKVDQQLTIPTVTCNQTLIITFNLTYTWYYHSVWPPINCPEQPSCCFDTSTSMVAYTTVGYQATGSNFVITRLGSVIAGSFLGKNVTAIITLPISNQDACLKPTGLEIDGGSSTLKIDNLAGPICTGTQIAEFCPGLHFG